MRHRLGTAFIFVTHDLAVARYVSDRIAVMHGGRLVEIGRPTASSPIRRTNKAMSGVDAREVFTRTPLLCGVSETPGTAAWLRRPAIA